MTGCNQLPRLARVHTANDDISVLGRVPFLIHKPDVRLPGQSPKQVDARGEHVRLVEADFAFAKGLPNAIRAADAVTIDDRDVQPFRMTECEQSLMQIDQ